MRDQTIRIAAAVMLSAALVLATMAAQAPRPTPQERAEREAKEKLHRDSKKDIRSGRYEKAIKTYQELLEKDPGDTQAHVGMAYTYLKLQNYQFCFDYSAEALKLDANNARAHALAGMALLRSGYIGSSVQELMVAYKLNPKEALTLGAAAEIDYYEGRAKESRLKAMQAYGLDSNEPDYLITLARASSRLEMFGDAADAYELFLQIAPRTDSERRDRIRGLIDFYRELSGMQVHQINGPAETDVPFELGNDRRPYVKVRINGREATFVIDTGSGFTVISKDAARRLGVSSIARGGTSQGVGGDGTFPIVYGLIKSLQLGDIKVKSIPCFIRPFHGTKERGEQRADGFVGLSVLCRFLTELDYKDNIMRLDRRLDQPLPVAVSPDVTVIPFRTTQNGLISIETELDGNHRINAILDSGASSTVISTAAVDRLKMRDKIIKGQTTRVIGAGGISDNVELLFIRNCRVADLSHNNLRALVLDFAAINETSGFEQSGILGGDFLRNFRVKIDFTRAQVSFQPFSPTVIKH